MFLNAHSISSEYLIDPNSTAEKSDFSVMLSIVNIMSLRGGGIKKDDTFGASVFPVGVRVDTETGKKFYDLSEGSYSIVFEQGIKKLTSDALCIIEGVSTLSKLGCYIVPEKIRRGLRNNLTAMLIVPPGVRVSFEMGSHIGELFISFDVYPDGN